MINNKQYEGVNVDAISFDCTRGSFFIQHPHKFYICKYLHPVNNNI